ncbi:MAG TPA: hypothetical protein PLP19_14735 [bacterium]|nr:hypothetical protein [bacterium]HPN44746.1 hypothetical protein [bacterium]
MLHNTDSDKVANFKMLYLIGGMAAFLAMAANLLDIVLGFGSADVTAYGSKSAREWFALFNASRFHGLYMLGVLNLVYQACLAPLYYVLVQAHRRYRKLATVALALFFIGFALYVERSAAIPMAVLADKFAAATTDAERAILATAGERILARGEDFTPGAFPGLIMGGIAALIMSFVMLRGGVFGKVNAWIGLVGFAFLSLFTILATFKPELYIITFYGFGMTGGMLALAWFALTGRRLFRLARTAGQEQEGR